MSYERNHIREMRGYSWGEQPSDQNVYKLNTNENPYPPSPRVQAALAEFDAAQLRTYPQPTADVLRDALAQFHRLDRDNVIVTNGGDEALRLAITTFVEPGSPLGMAPPSYSLYPVLAQIHGAPIAAVELTADWLPRADLAARLNAAGARLTCLPNPNAPSGSLFDAHTIRQLAKELQGVLLIDEAYADFVDPRLQYDAASLVSDTENLLILRTFSKGYSLAGLRLGYLLGHRALIEPIINKTRDSYNINALAQSLALAAWQDRDYAERTWAKVRSERKRLALALAELGLSAPASQANFLLARVPGTARLSAREIHLALKESGIFVRYFDAPRLRDKAAHHHRQPGAKRAADHRTDGAVKMTGTHLRPATTGAAQNHMLPTAPQKPGTP